MIRAIITRLGSMAVGVTFEGGFLGSGEDAAARKGFYVAPEHAPEVLALLREGSAARQAFLGGRPEVKEHLTHAPGTDRGAFERWWGGAG